MQRLGFTRSKIRSNYTLHTPDAFVRAPLPGMQNATAIVHISPHLGAKFTQYTAELQAGGRLGTLPAGFSRFVYVHGGEVKLTLGTDQRTLKSASYACFPPGLSHDLHSDEPARMTVIEKPYMPLGEIPPPPFVIGNAAEVLVKPLPGEDRIDLQTLLPDHPAFDFAVNVMTYPPGVTLPFVEIHVMEHGLVMLQGEGVYLLNEDHHAVKAGDVIYMAPYCPQWFTSSNGVSGYLIYKDVNRHPHV
ncbi:(S)-ureidoglycine aminohydrolase [Deinococcus roseus]|uniref:Cupin n=1 Tax=Deinococcus roseus TaxID=392414 RepID=A0ABQ2D0K8_9DEIO|nr:(S)-ureidoglycine aminohydrolase [Deinococcus roseus]GGJ38940.1 cupin [Deinococcus roseus]